MEARGMFRKYDSVHGTGRADKEVMNRTAHLDVFSFKVCIQIRMDDRKKTINKYGSPCYYGRIIFRSQHGKPYYEDFQGKDLYRTKESAWNGIIRRMNERKKYYIGIYKSL